MNCVVQLLPGPEVFGHLHGLYNFSSTHQHNGAELKQEVMEEQSWSSD